MKKFIAVSVSHVLAHDDSIEALHEQMQQRGRCFAGFRVAIAEVHEVSLGRIVEVVEREALQLDEIEDNEDD